MGTSVAAHFGGDRLHKFILGKFTKQAKKTKQQPSRGKQAESRVATINKTDN